MAAKPAAKAKATQIAEVKTQLPATNDLPDYLRVEGQSKGNENVTAKDLTIPRLGIIQGLSPQLESDNAKFIPGAQLGQMFNSLTNELYDTVYITDVYYRKEFGVFLKRKAGGGFRGSFPTEEEAVTAMEEMEDKANLECIETGVHFCLMLTPLDPDVELGIDNMQADGEIVLFMTSTKLKISRNLNSMIRKRGNTNRWAGVWRLDTTKETNTKGTFYNFIVSPNGWVSPQINAQCEEIYGTIGTRKVDREIDIEDEQGSDHADAKM